MGVTQTACQGDSFAVESGNLGLEYAMANRQKTDEGICRLDDRVLPVDDPSALCV
ncbi:hypothetical protein [Vreelandella utahensis]|uniref:hypothetical protein n=1 Tax=Vreelandella halophila TaxID=86177 RepID=UPI0015C335FE|nr:hypothetical protein [Halomonas utahensis]